jgi:transcriptional regulator NrdR family protein
MSACPSCLVFDSTVVMTRRLEGGWIKRWRRCDRAECRNKWRTFEMPVDNADTDAFDPDLLREVKR